MLATICTSLPHDKGKHVTESSFVAIDSGVLQNFATDIKVSQLNMCLTIVAVGDASSRKTELLIKYTCGKFYEEFMPLTFINNVQDIVVDRVPYSVHFVDTESNDDYAALRRTTYGKADCILLCYSVQDRSSFENISKKWCIEIRRHIPQVPIILVGTGIETIKENQPQLVTTREAENLKLLIGAFALVECSVTSGDGIDDVFIAAVRSTYRRW